jgi:hypothetical protein
MQNKFHFLFRFNILIFQFNFFHSFCHKGTLNFDVFLRYYFFFLSHSNVYVLCWWQCFERTEALRPIPLNPNAVLLSFRSHRVRSTSNPFLPRVHETPRNRSSERYYHNVTLLVPILTRPNRWFKLKSHSTWLELSKKFHFNIKSLISEDEYIIIVYTYVFTYYKTIDGYNGIFFSFSYKRIFNAITPFFDFKTLHMIMPYIL